ncbi:MAG TPA: CGNR zinc finger domain-containing protein [Thermoleophilaceae bacterium]
MIYPEYVAGTPKPIDNSSSREPAPGELATLQQFVNTLDAEPGIELLETPADLRRWLTHRELVAPSTRIGGPELRRAIEMREAFRAVLHANNGGAVDRAAIDTLDAAARAAELTVRWDGDGNAELVPARSGLDGAFGRLLAIAYRARVDGSWQRLKACPEENCGWAFYDHSRNRSSTWCSMAVCGNRAKARAFRERRARR